MYLAALLLLLLVLPAASVLIEAMVTHGDADIMGLVGKWFTFWAAGVRLLLAGVMQVAKPAYTAGTFFDLKDDASHAIVREVGFGNLAIGTLGILSLVNPGWVVPAALVGGLFYLFAGLGHAVRTERNAHEQTAMVSDLLIAALLLVFVASRVIGAYGPPSAPLAL